MCTQVSLFFMAISAENADDTSTFVRTAPTIPPERASRERAEARIRFYQLRRDDPVWSTLLIASGGEKVALKRR
jgi:hypothetical protein